MTRKTNPHRPGLGLGRRGRVFVRGRVSVCGCGLLMHQNVSASVSSGCLRFPPSFFFLFCSLLRWADSVEMQQQQKNKSINIFDHQTGKLGAPCFVGWLIFSSSFFWCFFLLCLSSSSYSFFFFLLLFSLGGGRALFGQLGREQRRRRTAAGGRGGAGLAAPVADLQFGQFAPQLVALLLLLLLP